ncbi:MAG: cation diffusion facilitator family transporter [Gemmatimonadota bacterium]
MTSPTVPGHARHEPCADHDHGPALGHAHGTGHGHDHAHGHAHGHAGHSHAPASFGRAFAIGTALNLGFVIIEAFFGLRANSVALLADAGHNLGDVLGLLIAWSASILASLSPTARRTYGFRSSSILAALANAIVLLTTLGAVAWEAVGRMSRPEPVASGTIMWVAGAGIIINGATALLFMSGRKHDLNIRGAYLHMLGDAGVSAAVLIAGVGISLTQLYWLDPFISLGIALIIMIGTWSLLRDSVNLALHAVPAHLDPLEIEECLRTLPGVTGVHDLHVWGMSTTEVALTAHLVHPTIGDDDALLRTAAETLRARFGIVHATLQIERGTGAHSCHLEPAHVV